MAFFYRCRIRPLHHPPIANLTLVGILHALADPVRLAIVRELLAAEGGVNCVDIMSKVKATMPKSTCSQHFQILREAGLVSSERRGVELLNHLRRDDLETRFPGLLACVLAAYVKEATPVNGVPGAWKVL